MGYSSDIPVLMIKSGGACLSMFDVWPVFKQFYNREKNARLKVSFVL